MDETAPKRQWPWYVRLLVGRNPLYTLFRAAIWACALLVVFKVLLIGIRVRGESMEPNYRQGQVKFINRLAYLRHPPQRGDVVAIQLHDVKAVVIKRIVALPGEKLTIRGGDIYINGKKLDEPYAQGVTSYRSRELQLEPNQYWIIGDNRPITEQYFKYDYEILGKVIL